MSLIVSEGTRTSQVDIDEEKSPSTRTDTERYTLDTTKSNVYSQVETSKSQSSRKLSTKHTISGQSKTFWLDQELHPFRIHYDDISFKRLLHSGYTHSSKTRRSSFHKATHSETWLGQMFTKDTHHKFVVLKWLVHADYNSLSASQNPMWPFRPKNALSTSPDLERLNVFKSELYRQVRFQHPHITELYGVSWTPKTNLIAITEYLSGGNLWQFVQRASIHKTARYWNIQKLQIAYDTTLALQFLHQLDPPIVHSNCNSRNVLLTCDMRAKLSDCGRTWQPTLSELKEYDLEVGSCRWIAPEILLGKNANTEAADIYSLGIILVELDTLDFPFSDLLSSDRNPVPEIQVLHLIASGALSPTLSSSCPTSLCRVIEQCTRPDPFQRPTSADVLLILSELMNSL
uniref:Protein kinase putative n=1 Tax=Albugo laibachii Nc14 TaxID=890382 RepID=F0WF69_9STRA|nr:protein kinase putative [Albugo laibachii Nc14]|eukprot:CCA19851.1 protein kinase putative [Albugo laibachii Nc14]